MNKKLLIIFLPTVLFIIILIGHKSILTYIFEKNISKITERDTNFKITNINFWKLSIEIDKIAIINKDGFFNHNIFEAESIFVKFDYKSIFSDEIIITELVINKPNFYFEIKDDNLIEKKVLDNLNLSERISKDYSPKIYPKKNKDINFIIFQLFLKNSMAHIYYSKNKDNLTLNLSDITFSRVGNLNSEENKKSQHYKDVLQLILINIYMQIPDQELKNLIKKVYRIN